MRRCDLCEAKPCEAGRPCDRTSSPDRYADPEDRRILVAAGEVEALFYGTLNRLEEIAEFARRLSVRRVGLAFCVGFSGEARAAADFLADACGFDLVSVCCKVGGLPKEALGAPSRPWIGTVTCNPVEQARVLDEAGCGLAVVLGLCVGHDSLFLRHIAAPATVLAVKDRLLAHNPVAALTCPYVRKRLKAAPVPRAE
jgi:uncharacterized metal-binding protein